MNAFEIVSRPVLFEMEGTEYSYWGRGSSFLASTSRHCFWITARHVIENTGGSPEAIRIFPEDASRISLPFNEKYTVTLEGIDDEEYKDMYALRIDLLEFEEFGDAPLTAIDVESGFMPAEWLAQNDELWIIGYPAEHTSIEFDSREIKHTRSVIRAIYQGNSVSEHCHYAKVETSIRLSSFDGLSGSPVFYLRRVKKGGQDLKMPLLVGMLLRGTVESSVIHFLSASAIGNFIELAGKA